MGGKSVLCPVDFSEESRRALQWASAIAQRRHATLSVLSVVDPLLAQAAAIRLGTDLTQTDALRDFVHATLPERVRPGSHLRMEVTIGHASQAILQIAGVLQPGLIVMGTHGLGGFRKLLLGSTTGQVLRRTEWPVLAVPRGAVGVPAADHPGVHLRKILLVIDFQENATAAMHWAGALASDIGVTLVLAHVVEPVAVPSESQPLVPGFNSDRVASGRRMLDEMSEHLPGIPSQCIVAVGRPADTIAALAIQQEAGLVVLGLATAEDSQLRKPGSIAYRVLRIGHVAVVVVPRVVAPAAQAATDYVKGVLL